MSNVVTAVEQPVFLRKHELAKLFRQIEKASPAAVEFVINTLNDEKKPHDVRMDAAKFIVQAQIKVGEVIAKDQLVRQVAEIKAKGLVTPLTTVGHRPKPSIDFDNLQTPD